MTEDVSSKYSDFDVWSSDDMISAMYDGQLDAVLALKPALEDIASAARAAAGRLGNDGRLIYVGAGTSGRLAVQDGVELTPTFGWPEQRTVFLMSGGREALTTSVEGAEDDVISGQAEMIKSMAGRNDVVIAVAASGITPYTVSALREAGRAGALTIGISSNADTPLLSHADYGILADTGSEIIAGSTRMKAGTAQKVILNMLSTAVMTQLGRVYNGLMVDMIVSNKKLEKRAVSMIADIAGCDKQTAQLALEKADAHIKTAVLISLGQTLEHSQQLLTAANGNLRHALELIKKS